MVNTPAYILFNTDMTVKEVKVQVSDREGGRKVYSVYIPSHFARSLFLKGGQVLRVSAVMHRRGQFRIALEGRVENDG